MKIKKGEIETKRQKIISDKEKEKVQRESKKSEHMKEASDIYTDKRWKKLRNWYITEHPLCENHLTQNILRPATCVHHKRFISSGLTKHDMEVIMLNPENLMSLCQNCHKQFHDIANKEHLTYMDYCVPPECVEW